MTKTLRIIDRKVRGSYLIVRLGFSSDWAARNPWRDVSGLLPYFGHLEAENTVAVCHTYVAGPFCIWIAREKPCA